MRKILTAVLVLVCAVLTAADRKTTTPERQYVENYSDMAVREMQRSGVPASITLAQGMLESRNGLSVLAVKGNNHFGIKCHDWKGKTMRADDETRNECFRVYDSAEESFRDHSDFLRYRDRYRFLFDYDVTDYKSWAYGLGKAGYATDPSYPEKLIRIIEDNDLARFDRRKGLWKKELPQTPSQIEEAVRVEDKELENFKFPLTRPVYSTNKVPFIYAQEGETFKSIAQSYNLFLREILFFNDLSGDSVLKAGDIVYLKHKKKEAKKGLEKYVVEEDGEKLRDISQRFAVRLKDLEKLNGYDRSHALREGDTVLLRKVR